MCFTEVELTLVIGFGVVEVVGGVELTTGRVGEGTLSGNNSIAALRI